ncbi:hypothetical protein SHIRM173S_11973 [Streptomyces hirsutus]
MRPAWSTSVALDELPHGRLTPPGGQGRVELTDVVRGPARLDVGEDVDGPVAELESVVESRAWRWEGPTMASRMPTERVNTPVGIAVACLFQASAVLGFFGSRKTSAASADRRRDCMAMVVST